MGDAAVCQCALTQLEAETSRVTFASDLLAWTENRNGQGFKSVPVQAISRCMGEQQVGPNLQPESASADASSASGEASSGEAGSEVAKEVTAKAARAFRWPPKKSTVIRTCLEGAAVANGMSCQLAGVIEKAYGEYPDSSTRQVRHLRVVDPMTGRTVPVACFFSGREQSSAVCRAPNETAALLPPEGASS